MEALSKLSSFHIQRFRSILDSGWRSLSNDNIAILIGQNESGKTSVLEALYSFSTGTIYEDMLRSDNSLPTVNCMFSLKQDNCIIDLLEHVRIPKDLIDICKKKKSFKLSRKWLLDKSSTLSVTDDELFQYFDEKNKKSADIKAKTVSVTKELIGKHEKIRYKANVLKENASLLEKNLSDAKKKSDQKRKQLRRSKKVENKAALENEIEQIQEQVNEWEELKSEDERQQRSLQNELEKFSENLAIGEVMLQAMTRQEELEKQIEETVQKIGELEYLHNLTTNEDNKKDILARKQAEVNLLETLKNDLTIKKGDVELFTNIAFKVLLNDIDIALAEKEAKHELKRAQAYYDQFSIAHELFKAIPVFEFFEDFSGLLPNKIDLEDLLSNNVHVEGYKAAQNYLNLAGLDSSFFREKNQRVLKQKIETLNSELTIDFQDYWSQKVGKGDKIKLHFELEHYDYTVPEKKGMPYIEFWIKDSQERLYPKQRSRGVRWFLSFYLELKSAAGLKNKNRVLLIDEPGLSLHARAQEDVLKVFEDLKENMQIVYCTHSPNLVKTEKLYRVLAVQRANERDDNSETLIYDPTMLSEASVDTLTPIYALMGVRLSDQQFVHQNNNVLVSDIVTYYYLHWLSKLFPECSHIHFIPATGLQTVPLLINILAGWQVNFGAVLFGAENKEVCDEIFDATLLLGDKTSNRLKVFNKYQYIEDIFSVLDFKKYILEKRVGITEQNSEFIMVNSLSRRILATNFVNNFNEGRITFESLDDTSQENIKEVFSEIFKLLKP